MKPKFKIKDGYCIFIYALCEGRVPLEFDENDKPVIYSTITEAQKSIAETMMEKLRQFVDGEENRDFEDAITTEEYVVPVQLYSDGSVVVVEE